MGESMTRLRHLLLITTALTAFGLAPASAGPDGPAVVSGSATVVNPGSAHVTVNQNTDKAIINWRLFDVGTNESVRFNQPNSGSIILNRVTGGLGPSQILGSIDANGRVFVINRDGILFGPNAVINTAGFLATTHDIRNDDFMAGRFNFNTPGRPDASIVNLGTITATSGGFAALVAPGVRNSGTITATLGNVTLASGNGFSLDFYGDKLVTLAIGDQIASSVRDVATGLPLKALVGNDGKIKADGGRVELTAVAARQVVDAVINTSGVIEANTVGTRNGMIVLGAATAARKPAGAPTQVVKVSGTLKAAGKRTGPADRGGGPGNAKGGTIVVTGENIQLAGAQIVATGDNGGGKVLIGGDWGGGKPDTSLVNNPSARLESFGVPTATTVSVDAATRIDASATQNGNGGKVILWADQNTSFAGTILTLGGTQFGNGGFAEVSSHGVLNFTGNVDTRAPNGKTGTLLLDPQDYTVWNGIGPTPTGSSILNITLQTQLATSNVTLSSQPGTGNGDIFVKAPVVWGTSTTLTLDAFRNIQIFAQPSTPTIINTGAGNLVMRADNTGIGTGTVFLDANTFSNRIDWSSSTGKVSVYYNPAVFGTQDNFTTGNGRIALASTGQITQYMLVNDKAHLQNIATNLAGTYALGRDIDASGAPINPLGNISPVRFTGILDGAKLDGTRYTISNLTVAPHTGTTNVGLFGVIGAGGVVRNLIISNASVTADPTTPPPGQFVGVLAGENAGTVTNVSVAGTITNGTAQNGVLAGGLIGQNGIFGTGAGIGTITNSHAAVTVTVGSATASSTLNNAGGLVGSNPGTITDSSASGTITGGSFSFIGGLVGRNDSSSTIATITSSSATGAVTTTATDAFGTATGGLVGFNSANSTITGSQASGNVVTTTSGIVGGLVGQNEGAITTSSAFGNASGTAASTASASIGGLVGYNTSTGQITSSTATGTVSTGGPAYAGGLVGVNSGTISGSTHTGGTISGLGTTSQSVVLGGLVGYNPGTGTIQNSSATNTTITGTFATAGGLVGYNSGLVTGTSLGQIFVSGVTLTLGGISSTGGALVGVNNTGGTIHNATAAGTLNAFAGTFVTLGGLVGRNSGNIDNSTASTTVNGGPGASGGLVGQNEGTITTSTATGNVTATGTSTLPAYLGGLVGSNNSTAHITSSSATGTVTTTGFAHAGGLIGDNSASLSNLSASNPLVVSGTSVSAGGLIGTNNPGATITNSQAFGTITSTATTNSSIGGLIGDNRGTIAGTAEPAANQTCAAGWSCAAVPIAAVAGGSAGGLVGSNGGTITNSFATGAVTATGATANFGFSSFGGLVGISTAAIDHSHATGAVTGTFNTNSFTSLALGGLIGTSTANVTASFATGNVNASFNDNMGNLAYLGGLIGQQTGATVSNSYATGNVTGLLNVGFGINTSAAGGLIGYSTANVTDSHALGAVATTNFGGPIGGLIGWQTGAVDNSYATGAVTSTGNNSNFFGAAGGLVGWLSGNITSSHATGAVTSNTTDANSLIYSGSAGGLVGSSFAGTISNSYATGNVTAYGIAGGLVGSVFGTSIVSSHATGNVEAYGIPGNVFDAYYFNYYGVAGGLVGTNFSGSITNSYATGNVTALDTAGGLVGSNFGDVTSSHATGNVVVVGQAFNYTITYTDPFTGQTFTPTFNSVPNAGGLVGAHISGTISDSYASGNVTGRGFIGGLVGANESAINTSYATGNVIEGPVLSANVPTVGMTLFPGGPQVTGLTVLPSALGGLVGANQGTITNARASGPVTGGDGAIVGGLAGINFAGLIQTSSATGNVTGGLGSLAGGLVAVNVGTVTQSFATGNVTAGDNSVVGALAGINYGVVGLDQTGKITQSYATGTATGGPHSLVAALVAQNAGAIDQTYGAGLVTAGPGSTTGGLVAISSDSVPSSLMALITAATVNGSAPSFTATPASATNSYWDTTTTGQSTSAGGTPQTSAQLASGTTPSGFDPGVWTSTNGFYPCLNGQCSPPPQPGPPAPVHPDPPVTPPIPPVTPPVIPVTPPTPPPIADQHPVVISPQLVVATQLTKDPTDTKPTEPVVNTTTTTTTPPTPPTPGGPKRGAPPGPGGTRPPPSWFGPNAILPTGMPALTETRFRNDEVMLQIGNGTAEQVADIARKLGLEILAKENFGLLGREVYRFRITGGLSVRDAIKALEANKLAAQAQPSYVFELAQAPAAPADNQGDSAQYIVAKLRLPEVHTLATGKGVLVAVVDSTIDVNHPDLSGVVAQRFDAVGAELAPHPHGTGMAGAIASHKRLLGIAPNARLLAIQAFGVNSGGAQGTSLAIVKGLNWAVEQGAKVINMSFAGPRDPILEQAIQGLRERGVILIAAAGNAGPKSPPLFPGADPNVIAVSATDSDNNIYKNANRGKYVAIAAPGVDILVPAPEGGYQLTTGTSVAAAHVSGVAALLLERSPSLKPDELKRILTSTATKLKGARPEDVGAGLVDPYDALVKVGPKTATIQ
jgi:mucin-19